MSDRKRKATEQGVQYREELAKQEQSAKRRAVNKGLKKQVDDLADLMGKMDTRVSEPAPAQMEVEEGGKRRRRHKTHKRRGGKRKTYKKRM